MTAIILSLTKDSVSLRYTDVPVNINEEMQITWLVHLALLFKDLVQK